MRILSNAGKYIVIWTWKCVVLTDCSNERYVMNFTVRDSPVDYINAACWGKEAFIQDLSNQFHIGDVSKCVVVLGTIRCVYVPIINFVFFFLSYNYNHYRQLLFRLKKKYSTCCQFPWLCLSQYVAVFVIQFSDVICSWDL